jgi:uncharacterized membrane protein
MDRLIKKVPYELTAVAVGNFINILHGALLLFRDYFPTNQGASHLLA